MQSWVFTGEEILKGACSETDVFENELCAIRKSLCLEKGSDGLQGRFLLLHWPEELIFLMVNLDGLTLSQREQYFLCIAAEQIAIVSHDDIEGNYKRIFIDEHGLVLSRNPEKGEMVAFVAPFDRFAQSPGSANMLIKYFDTCWLEVRGEIRKVLSRIGMHLLVHQHNASRSVFVLCNTRTIPE